MRFAMIQIELHDMYEEASFTFDAKDQADANDKAFKWMRYHSFDRRTIKARPATSDEMLWEPRNEYIPGFIRGWS